MKKILEKINDLWKKSRLSIFGFIGVITFIIAKNLSLNNLTVFFLMMLVFVIVIMIYMFIKSRDMVVITSSIPLMGICICGYLAYYSDSINANSKIKGVIGCAFIMILISMNITSYIRDKKSGDINIKKRKVSMILGTIFFTCILIAWSYIMFFMGKIR